MKKKAILVVWSLVMAHIIYGQELTIGDQVPNGVSIDLISSGEANTSLDKLKGKVILLDFWATWCGSCIVNMPHLDSLQAQFDGQLEIIAISGEEQGRLERFAENRPFSFQYAQSSDGKFQELFPHRVIPHNVIIDQKGKVVAITNAKNINASVIQSVIDQKSIHLPVKSDNVAFDYTMDYFDRKPFDIEAFDIQPYNPNVPGFTKTNKDGRRITMHNTTITGMYREAFQMSSYRLILDIDEAKVDWENTANRFNMDILVAPEDNKRLREILKEKLLSALEIKARVEQREMEVAVMTLNDSIPFGLELATAEKTALNSRGDQYISNKSSLADFAEYLENYGIVGMPVKDETGLSEEYKFDFSFDPENPKSFFAAMDRIGIKLKKQKRKVDVLVIYEESHDD